MKWYKTWYETVNDTDHMKDITCRGEDGEDHLMKNVSLEEMYCLEPEQCCQSFTGLYLSFPSYRHRLSPIAASR